MREILFRGKRTDNGEWVYGFFIGAGTIAQIQTYSYVGQGIRLGNGYAVDPATVGQFTGLTDKNGKKIFEGDVIKWNEKEWGCPFSETVTWDYSLLDMRKHDWPEFCEVIGTIYDNEAST